jgi:hypothetical protein
MAIGRRAFIAGSGAAGLALRFGPIWAQEVKKRDGVHILADCDTVFLGASAFAVAAASIKPANSLIIERNLSPASEFSGALQPNVLAGEESDVAREIRAHIEAEGLAAQGLCHTPPISDIVCSFILKKKINIFLNAEIIAVRSRNGGYEIRLIGSDGHSAVRCRRIVDTTPSAWKDAGLNEIQAKYLSATLIGNPQCELSRFASQDWELFTGALEGETYFRVRLPHNIGWTDARLRLHETFERFRASNGGCFKMGAEATEFGYAYHLPKVVKRIGVNWDWIPGAQYANLIAALNGGASWS